MEVLGGGWGGGGGGGGGGTELILFLFQALQILQGECTHAITGRDYTKQKQVFFLL